TDGAGALAAATRIAGFTSLDLDSRTAGHWLATTRIAGGEPFRAVYDTPAVYATAYLSNLPTLIQLDLAQNAFTYDLAQPVANVTLHAEVGAVAADVIVNDLPDQLTVAWNDTQMVYDANAAITRVRAWIDLPTLDALADVRSIPSDWTARWPNGTASFSTPGTIGSALVQASVNGGSILTLSDDHAALLRTGTALGASVRLTGIRALSADPRNGGAYALTLSPGGQPFSVYASIDGFLAQGYVSNLPTQVSLDLAPGAQRFAYNATSGVSNVWAYASASTSPLLAYASLVGLPARVDATWSLGAAPSLVFNASAPVTSLYGSFRSATGSAAEASLSSLPAYVAVSVGANDLVVDTRTAWNAASASGTVGAITARVASDGLYLSDSGNYADLYQDATVTRAALGYSGLKYLRVNTTSDQLFVDVQNSAPRLFTAYADTPEAYVALTIDSIPAHVRVTGNGVTTTYNAFGSTVTEIAAYYWDRADTTLSASIRGIPGTATLSLDMTNHSLAYAASTSISAIDVDAWIDDWYGLLRLTSIPTTWSASFADGSYGFDAGGAGIGSVRAVVTNHGSWTSLHGNHLSLVHVAATGGDPLERAAGPILVGTPEQVDASLLMTLVQKAQYKRVGTNNEIDLRMGGGTAFNARLNVTLANGTKAYLSAGFTPLPASIQGSFGERTTIATSQSFDLSLYGHYGTQAALDDAPVPPVVHGVSVRDGGSGAARAVKLNVWLTGLPTSVVSDPRNGTFSFTNWRPTVSTLVVDGELDDLLATPVDVYVSQGGIPSPQSLTFAMSTTDLGSGSKRVQLDLTQTAPMGALWADATYGVQHGRVTVSNIPDDIHATYLVQNGQSSFTWDATAPISNVYAGVRVTSQSATMQGYVNLAQLPSDFALAFGRASGGQGPTMTYTASASTLDVTAFVDASLYANDAKARLSFQLTDLGANVAVYPSGTGIQFTSTPATGLVYAAVWGTYNYYQSGSGVWDEGGWLEFPWGYHIGVQPNVNNLQVSLSNFSSFTMQWNVVSKFTGSYGTFSFSWDQINVWLDVGGYININVDWPDPFGQSTITLVNANAAGWIGLNVLFHKYTNHESTWFGVGGHVICDWDLSTTVRPHPHGMQWNGVTTTAAGAEGGAWYATPNPWGTLSPWIVDLVTKSKSPDGGDVSLNFDFDCV
ncbi:MAG TPA: hypothetical protein VM370_09425, partial [Candidatus Thermoplasmatota archaeon]|nr:hypothetical protein [Candidatus Thermoplasmatota archaeon]